MGLKMLEQIVPDFNIERCSDINQAIDLYNVHLYIKDGEYFPNWDESFINQCKTVDTKIMALLGRYCSTINDDNFRDIYASVELLDFEDFWNFLASFVDLKKLQWKTIETCVCDNAFAVQRMLYCPKYAREYDNEMAILHLAEIYENGESVKRDLVKALQYYTKLLNVTAEEHEMIAQDGIVRCRQAIENARKKIKIGVVLSLVLLLFAGVFLTRRQRCLV